MLMNSIETYIQETALAVEGISKLKRMKNDFSENPELILLLDQNIGFYENWLAVILTSNIRQFESKKFYREYL